MFSSNSSQVSSSANYIENVFSTYLYTGTGASLTITNNIDTSTYGGLTWIKGRSGVTGHRLTDTARGVTKSLASETTVAQATESTGLTAFGTTGFTIGADADYNTSAATYVSWTFRKQAKFFDIVTYTGDGTSKFINHNLGSQPGFVVVKATDGSSDWNCRHIGLGSSGIKLNSTDASLALFAAYNTDVTSTQFKVWNTSITYDSWNTNRNGVTYIAYLFAHDAGGFGLTGADNVISCGSLTSSGSGTASITLGYEPQWVMIKCTTTSDSWYITDTMRGMPAGPATTSPYLVPNTSAAEASWGNVNGVNATGWSTAGLPASQTFIYIAIRRGPMAVPTTGSSVFEPVAYTGNGTNPRTVGTLQATDLAINMNRSGAGDVPLWVDRLRGQERYLYSSGTGAEDGGLTGWLLGQSGQTINGVRNTSPTTYIDWLFKRAPSFFDEACYTGTGSNTTITHNLGAVPELMIVKRRDTTADWDSYCSALANTEYVVLNTTAAKATGATRWNSTTPTSSVFSVGTSTTTNASAGTYAAYLFATCTGVSKVGSYSGNTGVTVTVPCGFTGGVRFVLIKRTDSTGDWYVWDSARGIVAGNDPYLLLNSTAAEVTSTDYIDTYSAGFEVTTTAPAALNATGGTYIFLAIA
jgi:hypothetical protein